MPGSRDPYRGRFFGKPLHFFSHSGFQEAQTPPFPLVGEGGWGDEGHMSRTPAHPARRRFYALANGQRQEYPVLPG